MATEQVDWDVVLREYEQERSQLEIEFDRRRVELDTIIADVQHKIEAASRSSMSGTVTARRVGEYEGMKILAAAEKHLAMIRRPLKSAAIAQALLRGGLTTKGNPANFPTTAYNTLHRESKKTGGSIVQLSDKRFGLRELLAEDLLITDDPTAPQPPS